MFSPSLLCCDRHNTGIHSGQIPEILCGQPGGVFNLAKAFKIRCKSEASLLNRAWRNHSLCQNRCSGSQNDPLGGMSWALRLSGWRWAHWDRPTSCRPNPGLQPLCKGVAQTQSILEGPHCELGTVLKVMENTVPPYLGHEDHHTMMPTAAKRPYGKKKVGRVSPEL